MSSRELIDIVDDDGQIVGTMSRQEAERDNHITANVLIFLFNSRGDVWVQLRPMSKAHYPRRWDISACGGIHSGESPSEAAKRETLEETGLNIDLRPVENFLNIFPGDNGEERKRLSHLFIGVTDETPVADKVEVDEFKSGFSHELRADAEKNPYQYVPSFIVELDKAVSAYNRLITKRV